MRTETGSPLETSLVDVAGAAENFDGFDLHFLRAETICLRLKRGAEPCRHHVR